MQQSCPKTHFLRTLFQSAVTGGWSDGLLVAATRFSGPTGGLWLFGPALPLSSPGVSVYAHTSPATIYVAFAVTSVILILHYLSAV